MTNERQTMMTCDELRAYLNSTLADEREPTRMEQMQCHAQECSACAAFIAELSCLEQQLRELPAISAPSDLMAQVMQRVKHTMCVRRAA